LVAILRSCLEDVHVSLPMIIYMSNIYSFSLSIYQQSMSHLLFISFELN